MAFTRRPNGSVEVRATIKGIEETTYDLASSRREIRQEVKKRLGAVARVIALPAARRKLSPSTITGDTAASLTARSTTNGAYLTTSIRGKAGRYVGLLEWGGTVRRSGDAPRYYTPKFFMNNAVHDNQIAIDAGINSAIEDSFDAFETRMSIY